MAPNADAGIVSSILSDRIVGFKSLYDAYGQRIYGYASSLGVDASVAKTITSNTMLAAIGNVGRLKDRNQLNPWLMSIARNEAVKAGASATPAVGAVAEAAPAELHGDIAQQLGSMLQSGVLPDVGEVDDRGFPIAAAAGAAGVAGAAGAAMDTQPTDPVTAATENLGPDGQPTEMIGPDGQPTEMIPVEDSDPTQMLDAQPGPPAPVPAGAAPLIKPVTDDEPICVSSTSEDTRRKWTTTAVVIALIVMAVGAFGIIATGIGTNPDNEPTAPATLSGLTATGTSSPSESPTTPTTQPPTSPTQSPTTPTSTPTTPPTTTPTTPPTTTPPTQAPTSAAPSNPSNNPSNSNGNQSATASASN